MLDYKYEHNDNTFDRLQSRRQLVDHGSPYRRTHIRATTSLAKRFDMTTLATIRARRDKHERALVLRALERHARNIGAAARELGVTRSSLQRLMARLGIESQGSGRPGRPRKKA
jgi:transcriptional regulator with GAF, ATPase, and Fis domain